MSTITETKPVTLTAKDGNRPGSGAPGCGDYLRSWKAYAKDARQECSKMNIGAIISGIDAAAAFHIIWIPMACTVFMVAPQLLGQWFGCQPPLNCVRIRVAMRWRRTNQYGRNLLRRDFDVNLYVSTNQDIWFNKGQYSATSEKLQPRAPLWQYRSSN